ncbi:MAG TPA: nucleoside-diphosphate sugar epimerase/dehydratase [Terriglobia bacterium]|nr:nucleoside-diphosphate sugar epimerase/dehydratase [Terriglobia bacterium]
MIRRPRIYTRANQLIIDGAIFAASFAAAYLIRFEGVPRWATITQFLLWLPYLVAARLYVNWKLGIYHFIWRYVSLPDVLAIARALSLVTAVLVALRFLYPDQLAFSPWVHVPLGIIALEFFFSFTGTIGARVVRRRLYERERRLSLDPVENPKHVLLYGAGTAGILLAQELKSHGDIEVMGFLDDDRNKVGSVIAETKVLATGDSLEQVVRQHDVEQVVISIASPGKEFLSRVMNLCKEIRVPVKIIPSLREIFEQHASIGQLQDVRLEDLLGRDHVEATEHDSLVGGTYRGRRILVTGAGGSIGSELVRQLLRFEPACVAILDKDENSVYEIEQELLLRAPGAAIEPYIADIRQEERLATLFHEFRPQIVFHAAAHKHVPLMEKNPCEAILNNVVGTQIVLEVASRHPIERLVYISSDKAVNPTNVMGATKRIGEMMVQAFAREKGLPAASVRFGNVLGSRGSVIPLFQKQIAQGGPVTVTHPEVVRFFMTIPEAVDLVLCAGSLGRDGEIFVLDMGNPRKILDLASEMVMLAGLQPGKDIEIQITRLRPGEKLYEELVDTTRTLCPTEVDKLLMVTPDSREPGYPAEQVEKLIRAAQEMDRAGVYDRLIELGIGFQPRTDRPTAAGRLTL